MATFSELAARPPLTPEQAERIRRHLADVQAERERQWRRKATEAAQRPPLVYRQVPSDQGRDG